MKLEIGKFIIENDRRYSLVLKVKTNPDVNLSKKYERIEIIGYFRDLEQVFNKILNYNLAVSDVETIHEVKQELESIREELKELKDITLKSI